MYINALRLQYFKIEQENLRKKRQHVSRIESCDVMW